MGLRGRVILIITLPALLGFSIHGAFRVIQERRQIIEEEQQRLALTARVVGVAVENALRDKQFSDVQQLVSEITKIQGAIDGMRLYDRDLRVTLVWPAELMASAVPMETLRGVMRSGELVTHYERRGSQSIVQAFAPFRVERDSLSGTIEIVHLAVGLDRRQQAAIADALIRLALVLVSTVGITSLVLQRQVLRPLARLTDGIQRFGRGDGTSKLPVDRGDELGKVAHEFNTMAARLGDARQKLLSETERAMELEQRARQAATLAVAGKLAAGLAHEVGTPLNIISGRAEFVLRSMEPDDASRADVDAIVKQIDRISHVISGLLDVVRTDSRTRETIVLGELVKELVPLLRHAARQRGVVLQTSVQHGDTVVRGDASQLQQVLLNLVVNALEATSAGGYVEIVTTPAVQRGEPGMALVVRDSGQGIDSEVLPRIFDAFVTTKPRGQGTGLGLAICLDIAKAHGGDISVVTHPGEGTTFTLWLPTDRPAS